MTKKIGGYMDKLQVDDLVNIEPMGKIIAVDAANTPVMYKVQIGDNKLQYGWFTKEVLCPPPTTEHICA